MLPLRMLGLLIHMFLLSDVVCACPAEHNPLTLDPPMVVKQFGEEVIVNCSSTRYEHEGIYWYYETGPPEEVLEQHFLIQKRRLSNWNVKATCKINLTESTVCSKDLDITVYKNPDVVILNPINFMVEGKQYELQCHIINVAPVQNLTVNWYKDEKIIMRKSFTSTTKTPVNESSILPVNLSRGENGVQFRCEAELNFEAKIPVSSHTVRVSVYYAPEISNKTNVVYVKEGTNVTLNCEAEGNPAPDYRWTSSGKNMLENTSSLTITQLDFSETYNCTATNYLGRTTKQIHVLVNTNIMMAPPAAMTTPEASAPEVTDCPITVTPDKLVVRFGDSATVNCSTSAPAGEMGWEATNGGTGSVESSLVTWAVKKLEIWKPEPICFINLNDSQCEKKPTIIVYKTPDYVSVSPSVPGPMVEGVEYLLTCDIINVAPVQTLTVKWYRGTENVQTNTTGNSNAVTPSNASSTFRLIAERIYNGTVFTCKAELHLGPGGPEPVHTATSDSYTATVHYKPLMRACQSHYTGVEHDFSINKLPCQADGNPPPTVYWYYQGKQINASEPLTRSQAGEYTVKIVNILGTNITTVDITIEFGPSFTCNDHYEVEENNQLQTVKCEAQGRPTPVITWSKDGKMMDTLKHCTKHDSGKYLLNATNIHGTAEHVLFLNVLYAPKIKLGNYIKKVTLGGNVTLECQADGNPAPDVYWNYTSAENVLVTTWGSQKTITVTKATSTNSGDYICVATNNIGTATGYVTLEIKDTSEGPLITDWLQNLLIISIIIIVVVIILIVLHNICKKRGQYTFIPVPATRCSDIPLNARSAAWKA